MSIDPKRSTAVLQSHNPITDQIGAWMTASTLESHLSVDSLTPEKAKLLRQMALDLAEWLEGQA